MTRPNPARSEETNLVERLAREERAGAYPYIRPRDAATLIIVDRTGAEPRLLLGRRHERHVFMPGKYVFPGGRVDRGDNRVATADELEPSVSERLLKAVRGRPSPARARGLAIAAIRETYEEAGLLIGRPGSTSQSLPPQWKAFEERELLPTLSGLRYVARAITPPRRPRRFDTRFLLAEAESIAAREPAGVGPSGELDGLAWLTLEEVFALDLPSITRIVLQDIEAMLRVPNGLGGSRPVPFYRVRNGRFTRTLL